MSTDYATNRRQLQFSSELHKICTANLWGKNHIEERLPSIIETFRANGFVCGNGVAMAIQEGDPEVVKHIATQLGFNESQIRGYPTPTGDVFNIGLITDLKVSREYFDVLFHHPLDRLEFGRRAVLLLELETNDKPIVFAATHITVSPKVQLVQTVDIIRQIQKFTIEGLDISPDEKSMLYAQPLSALAEHRKIFFAGDFNASPRSYIYKVIKHAGFKDLTRSLSKHRVSWPSSIDLVVNTHRGNFRKDPPYRVAEQARWMDHIFCIGCDVPNAWVMGDTKLKDIDYKGYNVPIYPSDHVFVGVSLGD
jgi:hypothetical protein